ncbi:Creatinase/aminopeptidase [Dendrothele bispora CBS 962.96]|uniref:Creatinase/aminopeptidase n=1 Tax=Dendrothele bispora (strain CBS 962.96) TaxID=1314807 RepID=A0A4S8LHZ3_DENBC|nr:Creatinase/aminopeptidase [Dendrothele bispora CBS 962.96]
MRKYSLDYYLVPSEDAHNGEYIADSDQRRRFISGFTGSAGIAIITLHSAFLSTDSRFWIQAREELDHNWIVVKSSYDWTGFLVDHITGGPKGTRIGVDGRLVTYSNVTYIQSKITNHKSELVFLDENLVDVIWKDRPSEPREPLFVHDLVYAGEPASSKLRRLRERVREDMTDSSNTATIITHLPSIAWLLNLRGSGIPYNPLFHAYLYISLDKHNEETILFLDSSQAPPDIQTYLTNLHVERMGYDEIWNFLSSKTDKTIIITPKTSYAISSQIPQEKCIVLPSFAEELLSRKNSMEVDSLRKAYLKDGIAFTQFLAWLDSKLVSENEDVTEFEAAERLTEFRKTQGKGTYRDQKEPISASGPNAALPHYVAKRDTARVIDRNLPYLNDSGGQYLEGTCDTTRTVHLGTPDQAMSEAYTRVLQGHIAISTAIFPIGTSGDQLDALARRPLWKNGLDYGHGTGHGFGTFLTVHEGIQSFSSNVPLAPGHVLTVEPGCYKEGKWGVRIESALVVTKANIPGIDQENWLQFERLTVVPIHTRMVKWSMLTRAEKVWLEEHNQKCYEALAPHLKNDKQTLRWLRREVGVSDVD